MMGNKRGNILNSMKNLSLAEIFLRKQILMEIFLEKTFLGEIYLMENFLVEKFLENLLHLFRKIFLRKSPERS